jgi:hypothetical protein
MSFVTTIDLETLSGECGKDMSAVNGALEELLLLLSKLSEKLGSALSLTECSNVVSILRRLAFGSPCTSSVNGMAWVFGSMLTLSIVGLTLLSLRAALYNAVITTRKSKRREREFQEYKEYMAQFYEDAMEWEIDQPKVCPGDENSKCFPEISRVPTFDTQGSSPTNSQVEEVGDFIEPVETISPSPISSPPPPEDHENAENESVSSSSSSSSDEEENQLDVSTSSSASLSTLVGRFFAVRKITSTADHPKNLLGRMECDSDSEPDDTGMNRPTPNELPTREPPHCSHPMQPEKTSFQNENSDRPSEAGYCRVAQTSRSRTIPAVQPRAPTKSIRRLRRTNGALLLSEETLEHGLKHEQTH